jgi:perosamine synthetase
VSDFIPVNVPLLNGNERKYLNECIDSGWISSEGPFVKKFEDEFAKLVNKKYAISVTSGSSALEAAISALDLNEGDEVILPTFTIISCVTPLIRLGVVPVFIDSNVDTWNMDVSQIEDKITSKTKAIMAVHIFGLPVDMDPLIKLSKEYGLLIIEDAAQAIGLEYKGRPCGSFGDISTFSFYSNKLITSGEGGMIVTDNEELAERCRSLRNLCFQPAKRFVHDEMGWNFRMTNLQAAVGLAQLERLSESNTKLLSLLKKAKA